MTEVFAEISRWVPREFLMKNKILRTDMIGEDPDISWQKTMVLKLVINV